MNVSNYFKTVVWSLIFGPNELFLNFEPISAAIFCSPTNKR